MIVTLIFNFLPNQFVFDPYILTFAES